MLVSKVLKLFRKLASRVCEARVQWQKKDSRTRVLVLRWSNLSTWNSSFLDSSSIEVSEERRWSEEPIWKTHEDLKMIWRTDLEKAWRWRWFEELKNQIRRKKKNDLKTIWRIDLENAWRSEDDLKNRSGKRMKMKTI